MSCEICHENKSVPYKCPKCRIKYCSVDCYKTHKLSEVCVEKSIETKANESINQTQLPIELGDDEESDRIPVHILDRIGQSKEVLDLLINPHLRTMIKSLDCSLTPADDMQKAMMEPIFVQFVDQLLLIVEKKDEK